MIQFKCPKCEKINQFSDKAAGQAAACSICGLDFTVPAPVKDEADELSETPRSDPQRKSNEKSHGNDENDSRLTEDEPNKKRKSKKRKSKVSGRESDDEDRPRKRKSNTGDGLGRLIEVFTPRSDTLRIVAVVCCILVVTGLLSCILTMIVTMPRGTALLSIIAIPSGLAGLIWCMNYLTLKVAVHEGGIVHSHRAQQRTILWEEIDNVTQSIAEAPKSGDNKGITHVCTILLNDSSIFDYNNKIIDNIGGFSKIINEKTIPIFLPAVRIKYQQGDMANFGRLGVSQKGLRYKKQVLEWEGIEGVKIHEGFVTVNKNGEWLRWCKIEASSIPNLGVFLAFVNEIVGRDAV